MTAGRKKIKEALLPIKSEGGGIPKSVISGALNKAGLEKHAEEWLPQQGQYHCGFGVLELVPQVPQLQGQC